jgi:anti-anti-sigma factor
MGLEERFTVQVVVRHGVTSLALSGELDLATAQVLDDRLADAERTGDSILLDLRDLTFLDGYGLSVMLQARDRARGNGHGLVVVAASRQARTVFEATGTISALEDEEAIGVLERFTSGNGHSMPPDAQAGGPGA